MKKIGGWWNDWVSQAIDRSIKMMGNAFVEDVLMVVNGFVRDAFMVVNGLRVNGPLCN